MELDLQQVIKIMLKRWWIIVLSAMLCGAAALTISVFFITPLYSASTMLYVSNENRSIESPITAGDLTLSQKLVDTYVVILKSRPVLTEVINNITVNYSLAEIEKMISASAVNNTEVFEITVTCTVPEHAKDIANAIAEFGAPEIVRIVKAGSVEVVENAVLPKEKTSPNNMTNLLVGIFLGIAASAGAVLLTEILDTRIKTEEDLTETANIPVIGSIPSINEKVFKTPSDYGSWEEK